MSWMNTLYETYGKVLSSNLPDKNDLLPISHTLQNAHINIVIDENGCFKRAYVLEKTQIILPVTEKSASRTSGEAPHPLADKIHYVAKDYLLYGDLKKSYFEGYEKQLNAWCSSQHSHPKAIAVYKYIKKGQVVADLIASKILYVDNNNQLIAYWPDEKDKNQPLIFKVLPTLEKTKRRNKDKAEIEPGDALVCWSVEKEGEPNSDTWKDKGLQQSWINYDATNNTLLDMCYITGNVCPAAVNHPKKIRHNGDGAKLISANDFSGFTYRGIFDIAKKPTDAKKPNSVSYDVTQKAHNVLRWLISKQGFRNDTQVFVSWAVSGKEIPKPLENSFDLLFDEDIKIQEDYEETENNIKDYSKDIGRLFASKLNKYIAGYSSKLDPNEQIVIIGLDGPLTGRIGIIYYRELLSSEFFERIKKWHSDFAWQQRITVFDNESKNKNATKTIWPVSSPPPRAIAEAVYGNVLKSNDTLKKSVIERILPCIVDGRNIPIDMVLSAVRRACNKHNCKNWEWERNLRITCALYKGFYHRHPNKNERKEYKMALEEERSSRDYLYGRLLAIAEKIEETALYVSGEKRMTTAERLMQQFSNHPSSTWLTIRKSLQPYMQRLKNSRTGFLINREKEMDKIVSMFDHDDFISDKPLSGEFLLGYHCQRQIWYNKTNENTEEKKGN